MIVPELLRRLVGGLPDTLRPPRPGAGILPDALRWLWRDMIVADTAQHALRDWDTPQSRRGQDGSNRWNAQVFATAG